MKRLWIPIMVLLILFCSVISVSAESSTIELSFKLGSDTVSVNGKNVKTQATFMENGNVMVAADIFKEAFGADIQYKDAGKSVTIKYADTTITLYVDQKKAVLNGQEITIAQGPVMKGTIIMLPVKFIADSLGAECTFNSKTQEVKVIKEMAGDKSIKDFSLILKKTVKSQVGDSYYKWQMNFPKGLKISDRSFDGRHTNFESQDGTYVIYISVYDRADDTADSLMATDRDTYSDYTLVSQTTGKKDTSVYTKSVFKGDEDVWEVRNYLGDQWVLEVSLYMDSYEKYMNNGIDKEILDTFTLNYRAESQLEDLSDVSQEGFRKYEDKNLKFSLDVAPEWTKDEYYSKYNTIDFFDVARDSSESNSQFSVHMFSFPAGYTLDDWVKAMYQDFEENVNPDYYKIIKEENGTIKGIPCKKIYYTQNISGETVYSCDAFLIGKNYKYNVFYHVSAETYQDAKKLAKFERALNSFAFTEPDSKKVGPLMDPNDIEQPSSKIVKKNAQYKWSMEIPAYFTPLEDNNDQDSAFYGSDETMLSVRLSVLKNVQLEAMIEYFDEEFAKGVKLGTNQEADKQLITAKGTKVYQYKYVVELDQTKVRVESYFLNKNGNLYVVDIFCPEFSLSQKHQQEMEEIWQSMKFE
ncbi:copper amine oxidase N-terminal domain-containing protein [Candidatus Formimonas warabiya]|nr:stalk domain-containing protein [Candidatus Formimonas warabiya]